MARRSSKASGPKWQLDCTSECSLQEHAAIVLCCASLGNLKLLQHCRSICGNVVRIVDRFGRSALHVAASRGHLHVVEWLLTKKGVSLELADFESRWSALHRSVYYGHLGITVLLVKHGASLLQKDADGSNTLAVLNEDRRYLRGKEVVSAVNVYTWGRNSNMTLGHDHSKNYPEKLDLPQGHTAVQVILCKFHCVFLTEEGRVLTCGHGRGGRLGHGNQQSVVSPTEVEALCRVRCVAVAAARDHTIMLTDRGVVFTCGLNDGHQLGQGPNTPPQGCLTPKPVRSLRNRQVVGVGAGRYHTAICTSSEVLMFGQNLGQLGYEKSSETQTSPRTVPGINLDEDDSIVHLSASDAATACMTRKHRIFLCADYTVKSIRCGFFEKLSCLQFSVCASLSDLDHLRKTETEPKKILMLNSDHQVWYWEASPYPKKSIEYGRTKATGTSCSLLPGLGRHKVTQFFLGKCLTIVTEQGEVLSGPASADRPLKLTRVPMVQNARAIFTDFKANNFAFIQNVYRCPSLPSLSPSTLTSDLLSLLEEACLPGSLTDIEIEVEGQLFSAHKFVLASTSPVFASLFQENGKPQDTPESITIHSNSKLEIRSRKSVFEAFLHYLYGSHIRITPPPSVSPPHSTTQPNTAGTGLSFESTPDTSFASVDENDLTALYDQYATESNGDLGGFLEAGGLPRISKQSTPKKGTRNRMTQSAVSHQVSEGEKVRELECVHLRGDLQALLRLASDFHIPEMKARLEEVLASLSVRPLVQPLVLPRPQPRLSCGHAHLSDLLLVPKDGRPFHCHKCQLVARSDYFRSMLLMGWRESSEEVMSLDLPFSHQLLETVVNFLYTDEAPSITESNSVEWIMSVLVVADQLLMTRLKDMCEYSLANCLSLRNACEVLEFAVAYSADQLRKACLQFVCVNASALLEGRFLEGLDSSVLTELSDVYREMVPAVTKRVIGFPEPDPSVLPESYFLDEELPSSGEEGEGREGGGGRDDTEGLRSPVSYDGVSPKVPSSSSGSRKKRRRRSSQSETKRAHSPPTSPTEPTPPSHENGEVVGTASSPEAVEAVKTEEIPFKKVKKKPRKKLVHSFDDNPQPQAHSRTNGISNGIHKDASSVKHTPVVPDRRSEGHVEKQKSPPPPPPQPKTGWSATTSGSSHGASLREIMAEEERESQKQVQMKKSPPRPPPVSSSPMGVQRQSSHPVPSWTAPQTIPHQRQPSFESPLTSPSTLAQSPPPGNPWRVSGVGTPPAMSLRDLMAEAEAEERRGRELAKVVTPKRSSTESHVVRRQPQVIPHRQVSFADIVQAQEMELQDQKRAATGKALSLIQIEEQAIQELERLYASRDNPDEYITVERYNRKKTSVPRPLAQNSPWCMK